MGQATIYDVSRLSGVSTATVSRAFSDPNNVREATRRRVIEAANALNYQPSAVARAMAKQRTDKLAFIICKQGATILDDFYAAICEGVMRRANASEYQLVVSTAVDWKSMPQSRQADGAILAGEAEPELIMDLQRQNVKVVVANNNAPGFDLPCVVADEKDGVSKAIGHLLKSGRSRIAMLTGNYSTYITSERYNAFIDEMKNAGVPAKDINVAMCNRDIESATNAALEMLKVKNRPDAVFAFNDLLAAGVIKAASRLGISIPDELAVVGYDDSPMCTVLEPELTSVNVDCYRMGELCMDRLTELLSGKESVQRLTVVPVALKVRRSA